LDKPVGLTNPGDGSERLFIIEQPGRIRILEDGTLNPIPYLDISNSIACCGERGLLGLAFHPDYLNNGYFYINYTESVGAELYTVVAQYRVSADLNQADHSSEKRLLQIRQPFRNHNGGHLVFGPDGYLYIGLGDGGSAGDPGGNAQSLDTLLGKILRLDIDSGDPYTIPPDNPFATGGGLPEIWLYGLRNPWRFSIDRLTGDLYIGDVGQNAWEEIDHLPAGSPGGGNLGWDLFEGSHPFEGSPPLEPIVIWPVAEYPHNPDISVTGGVVYRGSELPAWNGIYFYGDYGTGKVWGLLISQNVVRGNELLFHTGALITSFGEGQSGEVYLVDYNGNILLLVSK
jgi:glucose/arabinose dehydrogenase